MKYFSRVASKKILSAVNENIISKNGDIIFDGISSWWVITHGHTHPYIVNAICDQANKIDQIIFANFTHEPAEELSSLLGEILPKQLSYLFFSDNGSTAVEVAIKMAIQAQHQKGNVKKSKIMSFKHAYHGDTVGAMSASGRSVFNLPYISLLCDFINCSQGLSSKDSAENFLTDFKIKLETYHKDIAAIIIEPIVQGAGGMIIWPIDTLIEIKKLCQQFEVYLICDEVMTGFGRTGKMFAFEHGPIIPDFLCLSKGLTGGALPLSATITTEEVYRLFYSSSIQKMFFHGHSFTANPIACAAAVANIKLFKRENTLLKIKLIEKIHQDALERITKSLPNSVVRESRFIGAIGAIELTQNSHFEYGSKTLIDFSSGLLKKGIFLRSLGPVIYLLPPYCTPAAKLKACWEIIGNEIIEKLCGCYKP